MIVTFNCDWTTPEEEVHEGEIQQGVYGVSAILGTGWKPLCPANDNLPRWLEVYG